MATQLDSVSGSSELVRRGWPGWLAVGYITPSIRLRADKGSLAASVRNIRIRWNCPWFSLLVSPTVLRKKKRYLSNGRSDRTR